MSYDDRDRPLPTPKCDWDNPMPTNAVTPQQMDVLCALHALSNGTARFVAKAVTGGLRQDRWLEMADLLVDVARLCRSQHAIQGGDST